MAKHKTPKSSGGFPRREASGWLVAPETPLISDCWWPFFDGSVNMKAPLDDPLWAAHALHFLRIQLQVCASQWMRPRTENSSLYWKHIEAAMRMAMMRIFAVAPLYMTPEEYDRIRELNQVIGAGLQEYNETRRAIYEAGGNSIPGVDLVDQSTRIEACVHIFTSNQYNMPPSPAISRIIAHLKGLFLFAARRSSAS